MQKFIGNDPVPPSACASNRGGPQQGGELPRERQTSTVLEEYSLSADATYRFLSMHCAVNVLVVMLPPMNYVTEAHGYKAASSSCSTRRSGRGTPRRR